MEERAAEENVKEGGKDSNSKEDSSNKEDGSNSDNIHKEERRRGRARQERDATHAVLLTTGPESARREKEERETEEERPKGRAKPGEQPTAESFATSAEESGIPKDFARAKVGSAR